MCNRCLAINGIADEIMALVPLMKSDRTDEMTLEAIEAVPSLKETGFTPEDFNEMTIFDLCGLIAIRAARATSLIDGEPVSVVLGSWGGMALQGELENSPFGALLEMLFGEGEQPHPEN